MRKKNSKAFTIKIFPTTKCGIINVFLQYSTFFLLLLNLNIIRVTTLLHKV